MAHVIGIDGIGLDKTDYSTDTLNIVLEVLTSKEEILDILKSDIKQLRELAEDHMTALGKPDHQHSGYSLFFRANSPRHSMNWRRLQKDYADMYKHFRTEGVVSLSTPTKPQSLVFAKVKEAE